MLGPTHTLPAGDRMTYGGWCPSGWSQRVGAPGTGSTGHCRGGRRGGKGGGATAAGNTWPRGLQLPPQQAGGGGGAGVGATPSESQEEGTCDPRCRPRALQGHWDQGPGKLAGALSRVRTAAPDRWAKVQSAHTGEGCGGGVGRDRAVWPHLETKAAVRVLRKTRL